MWVANSGGITLPCPERVAEGRGTPSVSLVSADPISPDDTGYAFDGLTRSSGVAVDPSGNVWVTNNWITVAGQTNPGGRQIVAFVGAAAPVPVAPFERGPRGVTPGPPS